MELTQRCKRHVRVAEFISMYTTLSDTIPTGSNTLIPFHDNQTLLFAGLVEALYARTVWLSARTDIWTNHNGCYCQVKCASVYLHQNLSDQVVLATIDGEAMAELRKVEKLDITFTTYQNSQVLAGNELMDILENVVQHLVNSFQAVQVKTLETATSQRMKFEYEMLQHAPGIEVLVLKRLKSGHSFVLFAVPLLDENNEQCDPNEFTGMDKFDSVLLSDSFQGPTFALKTEQVTMFIGYPMNDDEKSELDEDTWPLSIEWPASMLLSSQVTQMPSSSKTQSSIELKSSCEEMFYRQWKKRKHFIAELRHHVLVLEYDAVDFSHVFFMLQEQLNAQAPLRILVLQLEFTASFFHTHCMSHLQLTLLDGEEDKSSVTLAFPVSPTPPSFDPEKCAAQFLELTQNALLSHFYDD